MKKEHLEVLLEDINGKFDLVLEGHDALRKEIRELDRKNDERFDMVDFKIDALAGRVDGLENRFDGLEGRFDGLESKVDSLADDLAAHRRDTEAHKGGYRAMEE